MLYLVIMWGYSNNLPLVIPDSVNIIMLNGDCVPGTDYMTYSFYPHEPGITAFIISQMIDSRISCKFFLFLVLEIAHRPHAWWANTLPLSYTLNHWNFFLSFETGSLYNAGYPGM